MVEYCKQKGLNVQTTTNGYNVDPVLLHKHFNNINISLDTINPIESIKNGQKNCLNVIDNLYKLRILYKDSKKIQI